MSNTFKDEEEIRLLVKAFENCEVHPADFKHYQHLAVALWYLAQAPYPDASARMRAGIQKLAAAYGKSGYHETITVFWLRMVWDFLAVAPLDESITTLANRLIESYANKDVIYDYYSAERLNSAAAKTGWVEPDLRQMPCFKTSAARTRASRPACAE